MSRSALEISVIVPVRDGARAIPALLAALRRQTLAPERFEVIVVDNASSDDTAAIAERAGVRVVDEPVANRSRARNRGAAAARSRLYAFTDADCVPHPEWLAAFVACAAKAPLVAGRVDVATSEGPNAIERFETLWRFGQQWWVEQGWAATANLLVHADAFDDVGGFDPAYTEGGEDVDFCLRAGRAGHRLAYCDEAAVDHEAEWRLSRFLRRFYMHGYGGNQLYHRLSVGRRPWQNPLPAIAGTRAIREIGHVPEAFEPAEWRRMARLARLGYAARVAGSVWAEIVHAR